VTVSGYIIRNWSHWTGVNFGDVTLFFPYSSSITILRPCSESDADKPHRRVGTPWFVEWCTQVISCDFRGNRLIQLQCMLWILSCSGSVSSVRENELQVRGKFH